MGKFDDDGRFRAEFWFCDICGYFCSKDERRKGPCPNRDCTGMFSEHGICLKRIGPFKCYQESDKKTEAKSNRPDKRRKQTWKQAVYYEHHIFQKKVEKYFTQATSSAGSTPTGYRIPEVPVAQLCRVHRQKRT